MSVTGCCMQVELSCVAKMERKVMLANQLQNEDLTRRHSRSLCTQMYTVVATTKQQPSKGYLSSQSFWQGLASWPVQPGGSGQAWWGRGRGGGGWGEGGGLSEVG